MPTPAQLYEDALWESKTLDPNELLVCLCHAKHAYEAGRPTDFSWVVTTRLMERTKLSKGAALRARSGAVTKGWLTDIGPRRGHTQIRNYRLTIPREVGVPEPDDTARSRNKKGRFTKTGPPVEPVHETDRSTAEPQVRVSSVETGPQMEPVHDMEANRSTARTATGPPRGPEALTEFPAEALSRERAADWSPSEREDLDEEELDKPQTDPFTARLMDEHTATADEVAAVLAAATKDKIRSLPAWAKSATGKDDFARRLSEHRTRAAFAADRVARRSTCGHSDVKDPEPPPGWGNCLLCNDNRRRAELAKVKPADNPREGLKATIDRIAAEARNKRHGQSIPVPEPAPLDAETFARLEANFPKIALDRDKVDFIHPAQESA